MKKSQLYKIDGKPALYFTFRKSSGGNVYYLLIKYTISLISNYLHIFYQFRHENQKNIIFAADHWPRRSGINAAANAALTGSDKFWSFGPAEAG
jgi:hypothetical protein